jgi:adenine-specific DNA-methyltransferase
MPKAAPSVEKLRGGFYTPEPIATFLANWALTPTTRSVLEPSCGDGAFLTALGRRTRELSLEDSLDVVGCEVDPAEASFAAQRLSVHGLSGYVAARDFFHVVRDDLLQRKFDAVVGNPPFIRFQYFPEEHRSTAFELMRSIGFHPNRLTNAWVPFVAIAADLLSDHGRLALVLPAELLQVTYAAELRRYLAEKFGRITLITFKSLVFDSVEQEVVLLLAEGHAASGGIRTLELASLDDLTERTLLDRTVPGLPLDHSTEKWTQYFLTEREFSLVRDVRKRVELTWGALASVDVGVVTGNNEFFVLSESSRWVDQLTPYLDRIVHRSSQLRGLETTTADWAEGAGKGGGRRLLAVSAGEALAGPLAEYVADGEARGVNLGYKCRIRRRWHVVPSTHRPDAFMLRQIHVAPRVSLNVVDATSTDTVHRVRFRAGVDSRVAVASFHTSMTFAFSELVGRSYGGGVLELEPTEAEHLPVAYSTGAVAASKSVDKLLRAGELEEVAVTTDEAVRTDLGLAKQDAELLRSAWLRLRDRRRRRGMTARLAALPLEDTA